LTGLTYFAAAGASQVLPYNPDGWFQTLPGEALDINLSGSVAVLRQLLCSRRICNMTGIRSNSTKSTKARQTP
jgi:hypothetical protein